MKFETLLNEHAKNDSYNAVGDVAADGHYYLENSAACFFALAARALIEDGIDPKNVVSMMVNGAHQAFAEHQGWTPFKGNEAANLISLIATDLSVDIPPNK